MPESLMIKTKEGKYLLAEPQLEPSLLHFAKTYKASLFRIKTSQRPLKIKAIVDGLNKQQELPSAPPKYSEEETIYTPQPA